MNAPLFVAIAAASHLGAPPPRPLVIQGGKVIQYRADYVASLERFFIAIDKKARGYFTAGDLVLPGHHIRYPPVPYPQAMAPFRCVDANRSGSISQKEYVEYGRRAFDVSERNGYLDPVAIRHAISADGGCK
jgi:hypothetical protein